MNQANSAGEETILIVDDEEVNRAILSNLFCTQYTILEAADGLEGLSVIESCGDSLRAILLDVVMPRMDGIQVLRKLHASGLTSRVPVFLITAEAGGSTMREAYELGVMDVIFKPVVPFLVIRRVNSVVELFRARRLLGAEVERQRDQLLLQAEQMAELSMGMVEALSTAIEFRSDESGEHVRRLHDITCCLLRHTPLGEGIPEDQIRLIGIGAITHDVGKISIPDAVLNKRGRLTPEEFELMKTHTVKGRSFSRRFPRCASIPPIPTHTILLCTTMSAGTAGGYPDGLVGDEIPIWTQIVSLADVYDALVSRRCYKEAFSPGVAMDMILSGQCGVFNPRLLECFRQVERDLRSLYRPMEGAGDNGGSSEETPGSRGH